MAKKKLPLTEELVQQATTKEESPNRAKEEYILEEKAYAALDVREKERTEKVHLLKQIKNLLLMIYEKS